MQIVLRLSIGMAAAWVALCGASLLVARVTRAGFRSSILGPLAAVSEPPAPEPQGKTAQPPASTDNETQSQYIANKKA